MSDELPMFATIDQLEASNATLRADNERLRRLLREIEQEADDHSSFAWIAESTRKALGNE